MSIGATVIAGMRPFGDYVMPGFQNVQSTLGVQAMTQVPRFNAQMRGELAGLGLQAVAAKERQEELLDFRREELDQLARNRRREGLMGMAGSLLSFNDANEIAMVDPADLMGRIQGMVDANNLRRKQAIAGPTTYAAGAFSAR